MKTLILSLLAFFLVASPVGAKTATPEDCDDTRQRLCELVAFEGTNEDGELVYLIAQRLEIDESSREILSDDFIIEYLEGIDDFEVEGEGTEGFIEYVGPNYLPDADFRVVIGTTELHGEEQAAIFLIAYQDKATYIFILFGTHMSFIEYVEDVVKDDDLTVVPEDMEEEKSFQEKSI